MSYASEDAEAAQRICSALTAAGLEVWFDQSELKGGDAWDTAIRRQIRRCALFIPIISRNTHVRDEGYFRLEWKLAVDRSHLMTSSKAFLLPVAIDDSSQDDEHLPDRFREVQWIRLTPGEVPASFVDRVRRLLTLEEQPASDHGSLSFSANGDGSPKTPAATAAAAAGASRDGSTAGWQSMPVLLLVFLLIAVISMGVVVWIRLFSSQHASDSDAPLANSRAAVIPQRSIAVLPFIDLSEKQDQEYFADGMAEEILNLLVKLPELKVIGRTSSFQFKGKADDLRKIGTLLGAAYIVEGSVRRSGNHVRVTAQLVDTRDGAHRWSDTYDREVSDALLIQDEVATNVVRALQLEVSSLEDLHRRAQPGSTEAYDSYLRGIHDLNRFDQHGIENAIAHFRRALSLDPTFVPAAEGLARALEDQPAFGFVRPDIGFEAARTAALHALTLDPNSAISHAILGLIHNCHDYDRAAAQAQFKAALSLAPNDPIVLNLAGQERLTVGKWDEAMLLLRASLSVDPLGPSTNEALAHLFVRLGRLTDAESTLRHLLAISPTYEFGHHDLGIVLLKQGRVEAAMEEMQRETLTGGRDAGLAVAYYALHRRHDSDEALARLLARSAEEQPLEIAEIYAYRGQSDRAFAWLDRAYALKEWTLVLLIGDPLLTNLESDARYRALLLKMNLPAERRR